MKQSFFRLIWLQLGVLAFSLFFWGALHASEEEDQVERLLEIQALSWSPDGKTLLFSSNRGYEKSQDKAFYLWRVGLDGKQLQQLSFPSKTKKGALVHFSDRNPQWSPDGRRIAFDSDRGERHEDEPNERLTQIFLCDFQGRYMRQISSGQGWMDNQQPVWHPQGKLLAWVTDRNAGADILLGDTAGKELRYLAIDSRWQETFPSWSSGGKSIVFLSKRPDTRDPSPVNLSLRPTGADTPPQTTKARILLSHLDEFSLTAMCSPFNDTIALIKQDEGGTDLWTIRTDGTHLKRITRLREHNLSASYFVRPTWSPDARRVAFVAPSRRTHLPELVEDGIWICEISNGAVTEVPLPSILKR